MQRLAALLRRLPVLPLPGGGNALVQPIHQDDVTRAIRAALARRMGRSAQHRGRRAGSRCATPISSEPSPPPPACRLRASSAFPLAPLIAAATLSRFLPLLPTIRPAEVRRLTEDKAFDIAPMRAALGFDPKRPAPDGPGKGRWAARRAAGHGRFAFCTMARATT